MYSSREREEQIVDMGRTLDVLVVFFFFQAEDGIRDLTVTGVQTCALPVFRHRIEDNGSRAIEKADPFRAKYTERHEMRGPAQKALDRADYNWSFPVIESLFADIRFAVRWLRKSPGFAIVAIASLAIGIGFNTALFTVVDALLFKPLPVAAPERLIDVFTSDSTGTVDFSTSSYPDYLDLQAHNDVFDGLVGYSPMMAAVNLDSRSRLAMGEIVTGNYFHVFGVGAAIGRTILPADDAPGAERVAMVSHRRSEERRVGKECR